MKKNKIKKIRACKSIRWGIEDGKIESSNNANIEFDYATNASEMKDIAESYNSHFEKLEQEQEELYIIENIYYEIQNAAQNGEYFIDYEIEKSNLIKFSEILINDRYFLIVKKIVITILQLQYRG